MARISLRKSGRISALAAALTAATLAGGAYAQSGQWGHGSGSSGAQGGGAAPSAPHGGSAPTPPHGGAVPAVAPIPSVQAHPRWHGGAGGNPPQNPTLPHGNAAPATGGGWNHQGGNGQSQGWQHPDDRQQHSQNWGDRDHPNGGQPRGWQGQYHSNVQGNYRPWGREWHNDQRYDWRGWRDSHRDAFHVGRYYPPYRGYYYSRLAIGFILDPLFWGDSYLIYDPWEYHLPPAYPPYRWVRYYDDAVLVDTNTGQTVDVIYDFFW